MSNEKTAHIISHSHWDREWYMSLEEHRYHLVELMDDLLDMFKNNPDFHSFHLDGQTILIDDYLAVRPQKKEEVEHYIKENRLIIGPWYVLQDAFLTSSEANIRNLLYGLKDTNKYGQKGQIGYFPDTFGIYGQAPQLLKQAGIEVAAFGRGVTPTGFNNQVFHSDDYSSPFSELKWESPDGSEVLGILFANWYSNGNEIPVEEQKAKVYWEKKLNEVDKFASTSELLFLNGCDHQPLQKDITEAISIANRQNSEVVFKHSSFENYIRNLKKHLSPNLQTIKGELRNQKTDGWATLVNTASSRVYLKVQNDYCQTLLEKRLEPMGIFAINKDRYRDYSEFYWKMLMENHPHDSICGCSVDEVHKEMETRFLKVKQGVEKVSTELGNSFAVEIDTNHANKDAIPFVVFDTYGHQHKKVLTKKFHLKKIYFDEMSFKEIPKTLERLSLPNFVVERADNKVVDCAVKDLGIKFGYDLPKDGFRRPYYAKEVEVTFLYDSKRAVGYERCFLVPHEKDVIKSSPNIWDSKSKTLENDNIAVAINENGSYTVKDKNTNKVYRQLGIYENTGDIGNEYMYKQSGDELTVTSENNRCALEVVNNTSLSATVRLTNTLEIPTKADDALKKEKSSLVWHPDRKAERGKEKSTIVIVTELKLEKQGKGLKVTVNVDNNAKDHRLRALFPIGETAEYHFADSIFEIAKRPNNPASTWENPSFDHHMQRFVSLNNKYGLTIATKGLHEYEIVDNSTICVTLLRSVGEMGDWGHFETPEAQCLGENKVEFMLIPHKDDVISSNSYLDAYSFPYNPLILQQKQSNGSVDKQSSYLTWNGKGLVLTALKAGEGENEIIARWYNPTEQCISLEVESAGKHNEIFKSNIVEEKLEKIGEKKGVIEVKPHEITTIISNSKITK
ncbi:alpha-mannosidase [Proteinivorax tanatarense]|uniref:Alpha-mannosidase n=1 Tax=Proteinivorax tanatarense TaxID=1260629 RepID=A0AAU7VJQ4_9FIRM